MVKKGEKISFYSVEQETGTSRSYLYNNQTIFEIIKAARTEPVTEKKKRK